ncbi:hypothetical protein PHYPSEUDO_000239 [Phytophthora pseudosyringae]|uniref:Uncharacterized protein n=1 Tax=Phytophthora pseudosyringae TaxID=221518 RepID=A0A8T1WH68_9STRA|nr:hypothetical protein PHYPSEUDO_000239 [Phytophthora pseudosyringae]
MTTEASSAFPLFSFDTDNLHTLQEDVPTDLQFLRLRLRFGLPERVQVGQQFRLVVDLVDEMGQPVPEDLAPPDGIDICIASQRSTHVDNVKTHSVKEEDQLILKIEEKLAPKSTTQQQTKWVYGASLQASAKDHCSSRPFSDNHVSLLIQMKQTIGSCDGSSSSGGYRNLLQTFCARSAWLSDRVLVLPLQVELQVSTVTQGRHRVAMSTSCQRLFRTVNTSVDRANDTHDLVVVEENYGDAMGSHVWDASILLSFAVIQAGIPALNFPQQEEEEETTRKSETKEAILELGSGCGLFAAVLAKLAFSREAVMRIFTEKSDCTERLQANLDRNESASSTLVLPLEWGAALPILLYTAGVRVVFAADVLYNWAAHEAFLATLDSLAQQKQSLLVFLAHKRRGKASATRLDALASGTFDPATLCGAATAPPACRWSHWHVEKLSALGRVDFFRLSYARKVLNPADVHCRRAENCS